MDWKKELKETNWLSVFCSIAIFALFIAVIYAENLPPMSNNFQYALAVAICFVLVRDLFRQKGE